MDPQNNPQPTPPPAEPQAPVGSEPQQPQFSPQVPLGSSPQSPKGGLNKKMLTGLVAGGVALVVLIIAAVLVVSMMSVSKKDYQAALSQFNEVSSANYTLSSKASSIQYGISTGTETSFDNDVSAARKALDTLKEENKKLGDLKAVKVGEGKEKYKTFNEKLEASNKFVADLVTSISDLRPSMEKCDNSTTSSASNMGEAKSAINDCVAALDKIKDTPNADVKEFIGKIKTEYQNLASVADKLSGITDPYGAQYDQYKSLRDQVYKVLDNIRSAQTDFRSNLEKHADEVDPKNAAKELGNFLSEKASK